MEEKGKELDQGKRRVIIDLSESQYAHSFPKDQNIHQAAFDKLIKLIRELANKGEKIGNKNEDNDFAPIETHDAIAVFGQRGVGKTSFLRSVVRSIKMDKKKKECKSIEVLPLIDPTLIEEKGHVFLLILSLINKAVVEVLEKGELNPKDEAYNQRNEWKAKLEKLAKGLPSLDNVGVGYDTSSWQDATYIMNKGLDNVGAAHSLQRNFRSLVQFALQLIDKKVFLLVFDDIDVNFQRGWSVLETIRKYLTIPEIITIISGNEKLYAKNVRKAQWKNFGKALLKNESDVNNEKKEEYSVLVDELEEQYMQKLFKADHRIQLNSLLVYYQRGSVVSYYVRDMGNEHNMIDTYDRILEDHGIRMKRVKQLCHNFLMSMPIRSQIQFLVENREGNEEWGVSAFRSRMLDFGIDIDRLGANTITNEIIRVLLSRKLMEVSYQLLPNMDSYEQNAALLGLNLCFSHHERCNMQFIFDYLLRIGYCRNMTEYLRYKASDVKGANIEDMCEYSNMLLNRPYRDYIGNAVAYTIGEDETRLIGQLRVKGKNSDRGTGLKIDEINKINDRSQRIIAWLPYFKLKFSNKNDSRYYYSIYMLLASIGMIVGSETEEDIIRALKECLKERDYIITKDAGKNRQGNENVNNEDEEEINIVDPTIDEQDFRALAVKLHEWKEENKDVRCSPHMLGRISTRTYNALEIIQKHKYGANLGAEFQLFAAALLNACLIEESQEQGAFNGVSYNNVRTEIKVYLDNKDALMAHINNIPLSKMLIECPLFEPFLDKESEMFKVLDGIARFDIYGKKVIEKKQAEVPNENEQVEVPNENEQREVPNEREQGEAQNEKEEDDNK